MIALIVLFVQLMITCVVLTARLTYWMIKLMIIGIIALAGALSSAHSARQRSPVGR